MEGHNNIRVSLQETQVKQENLLLFCGMAFMAAGPAFWFLMNSAINTRLVTLNPDLAGLTEVINVAVALLFAVSGAALALAGWGLSAWYTWREVKSSETGSGGRL
ncbi:hypothetical protein RZQ20_25595 [Raoultella ornithinolytica]|uniref:hypothetical protein n=1 Tax=Raoultella ornithinolytica TaxID=54291 RepID=UPI00255AD69A|nr:hypothetical protein [Raoultella ornithinolytica]MDL4585342.1 hypothetical protein [Raoultella ornithinolytica]MDV1095640.1 hypothetical protein [Raoultella ornithinolytica]MDV1123191.1 hypothetical protein [Raoultella ornithinolytica]MDV1893551.1 hypothetical protein [Raoultella ornithinolytica]HEC2564906.1 hypothetical protein [Raoultella ornithinolytica]